MWREMNLLIYPTIFRKVSDAQGKVAEKFNHEHQLVDFQPGDSVMVFDSLKSSKWHPRNEGSFIVVRKNRGGGLLKGDLTFGRLIGGAGSETMEQ